MAATRRKTSPSRKKLRVPPWALVVGGLAVGVGLALLIQTLLQRDDRRDGLAGLLAREPAARPAPEQPAAKKDAPKAPKPKYDFYTVLPEVETVLPERRAARASAESGKSRYVLQAASFANFEDADQLKAKLALNGLVAHIEKVSIEGKGDFHRVRLGPFKKLEELDAANQRLKQLGLQALRLKVTAPPGT